MEKVLDPFEFRQCVGIPKFTGERARNLMELRDIISVVSDESIFHHTCQYFLGGRILDYTNDFAQWAGESLEERALSEQLSNIDPYGFKDISAMRDKLLNVIDDYLSQFPVPREVISGDEFYFSKTITLIFSSGIAAKNLAEFLMGIKYIDAGSIYYHFYEARVRLGGGVDDFSKWIDEVLGKWELAKKIKTIDLFMHSIEDVRRHIIADVEEEVKRNMEVMQQ